MEAIIAKHFKPDKVEEFNKRFSLVKDLANNRFTSPEEIYEAHPDLITPQQAQGIWKNYNEAKVQKGGLQVVSAQMANDLLSPTISKALNLLLGIFIPEVRIPIKVGLGFIFILSYIEKLPGIGALVASALDITATILPVWAVSLQNLIPPLVALIPLPYMNFAGMFLGYIFSAVLLFMAIMIGISRKQFGSAIEATAGLIPVFGPTLMNGVKSVNVTAAKLNARRIQVVEQFTALVNQIIQTATQAGEETKASLQGLLTEAVRASGPPQPVPAQQAGKRFSRRTRKSSKWKTRRTKSRKH